MSHSLAFSLPASILQDAVFCRVLSALRLEEADECSGFMSAERWPQRRGGVTNRNTQTLSGRNQDSAWPSERTFGLQCSACVTMFRSKPREINFKKKGFVRHYIKLIKLTDELMYCLTVFPHPLILHNDKKSLYLCVLDSPTP